VKKTQARIQAKTAKCKNGEILADQGSLQKSCNNPQNWPQADITTQYELLEQSAKEQAEVCCKNIDVGRVEYTSYLYYHAV
jgi:hypothetical protein